MQYEVIIAEDEELILNNLIQKVNAHPAFKVAGAAQTGTDALNLVKEHSPILLMTDIRMPVMDEWNFSTKQENFIQICDLSSSVDFQILNMPEKPST